MSFSCVCLFCACLFVSLFSSSWCQGLADTFDMVLPELFFLTFWSAALKGLTTLTLELYSMTRPSGT